MWNVICATLTQNYKCLKENATVLGILSIASRFSHLKYLFDALDLPYGNANTYESEFFCKRVDPKKYVKSHTCFKNWTGSDIIREGFETSISAKRLIYCHGSQWW